MLSLLSAWSFDLLLEALTWKQTAQLGIGVGGIVAYLHLTGARWLLDRLAQLFQCAWLQATSPHRGRFI